MKKKTKKKKDSNVVLQIRIDENLRKSFLLSCENNDMTASQEIRKFIRKYVAQHGQEKLI